MAFCLDRLKNILFRLLLNYLCTFKDRHKVSHFTDYEDQMRNLVSAAISRRLDESTPEYSPSSNVQII